ncbi:hypothetical protein LRH25_12980 [Ideonella azotifigens]|uniref:Lipocalin-like domain-containing protein n=1 Tax=Ideonella azotifigens TaxID=513160 RepID=A0ABP3V9G0_9BURK|nr:hypothetical protein [Ideonella azotifigens]MCD2341256.1 hypothetical protein [Ideonella azotifigens]
MSVNQIWGRLALGSLLSVLAACGGGGGDDDKSSGSGQSLDVAGTWDIAETKGSNNCGDPVGEKTLYSVTIQQTGNSLKLQTEDGQVFNGSIQTDTVEWTGSYPEEGGTTTLNELKVTVTSDAKSLSGSSSWTWTKGSESCSGTTEVSGTRAAS